MFSRVIITLVAFIAAASAFSHVRIARVNSRVMVTIFLNYYSDKLILIQLLKYYLNKIDHQK